MDDLRLRRHGGSLQVHQLGSAELDGPKATPRRNSLLIVALT